MLGAGSTEEFIDDAEHHNQWWRDGTSPELSQVVELTPRSDFHNLLKNTNDHYTSDVDNLVYTLHGQTGIGKTTLFHQLIAALHDKFNFPHQNQDLDITSAISPRQILYLPLEESLYQLEQPHDSLDRLTQVVDYFQTHIAPQQDHQFIFLDDIQALQLNEKRKAKLVDLLDDKTYLFLTGIVESQVQLPHAEPSDTVETIGPWPILPMKFIDAVQTGEGLNVTLGEEFQHRLEHYQSSTLEGPAPIKTIRDGLSGKTPEPTIETAVHTLSELYFDTFDANERAALHNAARAYLRSGGILHPDDDPSIRNELTKSHYLLFLYKELANYKSIQHPENLHQLSAIAATNAGVELQYTDLSDQAGVDRRTVDTYLDALDEGIAVTESRDYSLRRHRRTRLYLRNPRHLVLLSQRQEHHGFKDYTQQDTINHDFEYKLARTVAFDHAKRLAHHITTRDNADVEYTETDSGLVDYIIHHDDHVVPFILSYHPHVDNPETIAAEFDPHTGQHTEPDSEDLRELDYQAPYRFIITDSLPKDINEKERLTTETDDVTICYLPYWLFLLIC